jgi:hypothetical protein
MARAHLAPLSHPYIASSHRVVTLRRPATVHIVRAFFLRLCDSLIRLAPGTWLATRLLDYSLPRVDHARHVATRPAVTGPAEEMEAWKWNR